MPLCGLSIKLLGKKLADSLHSETVGVVRTFCPQCGTTIGYTDQGAKDELYLNIGFMDNPERFPPQAHAYWRLKLPWIEFSDELPHIDAYSRERNSDLGYPKDRKPG